MSNIFLIVRTDAAGSSEKRIAAMDAHLQYTITNKHKFHIGGAIRHELVSNAAGSAMIVKADSLEDAREFAASDPFDQAGVYARTDVWHFNAGVGDWLPAKMRKF